MNILSVLTYALSHQLGRRQPIRTIGRIASWQIRSRLAKGLIHHRWVNDSQLVVRRHMVGATGNIYLGLHEFPDMAFLLHFLRPDDLFLDIGANVGTYTVLASAVCGARTWSFEPDTDTIINLNANISANAIETLVTLHATALGAENGTIAFTIGLDTINRVADSPDLPQHIVPVRRLDDVVGAESPAFIKIDVEGHEEQVLSASDAVLAKPSLKAIEIETLTQAIEAKLAGHGFVERFFDPFRRTLSPTPLSLGANNRLFIRDEAFVEGRIKTAAPFRIHGQTV